MNNEKGTKMTTVKLTAEQIALLLQILDEQLSTGKIEGSERPIAFGALAILEEAENEVSANVFSNLHLFS
jgi:hypothetical protein